MASVTAEASMAYYCHRGDSHCSDIALRWRSIQLACLYQFLRETACDVRDIEEDTREGLKTLPVKLGKGKTVVLMAFVALLLDLALTQCVVVVGMNSVVVRYPEFAYSIARVGGTMMAYSLILRYPRANLWAWGTMSLFGLAPVLSAQAALRR